VKTADLETRLTGFFEILKTEVILKMRIKTKEKESGQFSEPPNTNLILPHPTLNIQCPKSQTESTQTTIA
jgi:hypothetical protein